MRIIDIGGITSVNIGTNQVDLTTESGVLVRVAVLSDDVVRVTMLPEGDYRLDRTWWVVDETGDTPREGRQRADLSPFELPQFTVEEDDEQVILQTALLRLRIIKSVMQIQWETLDGEAFAEDSPIRPYAYDPSNTDVYHFMRNRHDDLYYGFGETSGNLNKHGRHIQMRPVDAACYNAEWGDPLYKHWPFYITLTPEQNIAYGLFYDNMSHVTFDMGQERHEYYRPYRHIHAHDGDLEYYMIYGPTITDVAQKFTKLTGRMALPPRWSLGYLGSTMTYTEMPDAQEQLKNFVRDIETHDIPCDVFHLSSGYTVLNGRREVFNWNNDRIPDPHAMVNHFHEADIKISANIKPYIMPTNPHHETVDEQGGFIKDDTGDSTLLWVAWAAGMGEAAKAGFVDFTNPTGFDWWKRTATKMLLDYGIDSLWNDNNEFGIWDDDALCDGFGEKVTLGKIRPVHTLLMVRASTEAQIENRPDERPFVLTRSGCPGIQRYAQTWSGDNDTSWHSLKFNIPMGLGMSLSGMPNIGHDVGGFCGEAPPPELLLRWVQNGIFHPRFTMHSWNKGTGATEPWMYPEVLPAIRDAIHFRYRLIPYLYTLFVRAHNEGRLIIAPMVYHFQDDPQTHNQNFDFMLGDDLLVPSIYEEGATRRDVYLPQNTRWCDWHTGEWYAGGQTVTLDVPLERFPLLVRENAIIPLRSTATDLYSRVIYVFPGEQAESNFTLYEDDGVSNGYQRGEQTAVTISLKSDTDKLHCMVSVEGDYQLPYAALILILPENETRPIQTAVVGDVDLTVTIGNRD